MELPRIMIGAPASGSGKTLVTCGILQAFVNRGLKVASFKCGPDYIDPLFHSKVIGTKSKNLDTFFSKEDTIKYLFGKTAKEVDISVMEGVMGYYDGVGGISTQGSSYELAGITNTPSILVINCKGMSLSLIPLIQGFLQYRSDSNVIGIILNQMSQSLYMPIKEQIEKELGIKVLGYVPFAKELVIESRHLGLVMPEELEDFHSKLNKLAGIIEKTVNLDEILKIAKKAGDLSYSIPEIPKVDREVNIAIAKDEAFCFYYQDNLDLLQEMGAKLVEFSPIHDKELPKHIDGILLGGGYPELVAEKLSANKSMRESIKAALNNGLPCLAECGGFMYLHQQMEDISGKSYPMVGSIVGGVFKTDKLKRFGYITLTANQEQMVADCGDSIVAHEFHYFDSNACGESFTASKPLRKTQWSCIHGNENMAVGFPHLYYYSNMRVPFRFLSTCLNRKK
ncbi:cobyrinate a,c-diamide synthase [Lachnoclostridium phytofermentans]|uniref:Cobyrinate a,c-diamide synthase n=1 Tax=Lachnoclostridium phytofermentans (strain ATCC 700394 / DSM 18823 / ISDg) TaxID=357809 RepID=A9KP93_LACP7|nr:cobyrinate a,c-diamide synthase [Lachnoclostridium phytofermentans]ABX41755.1 cobyrinic acid a,c-diamide synthase [Lachnoclostridium phytofermentans ISDg]